MSSKELTLAVQSGHAELSEQHQRPRNQLNARPRSTRCGTGQTMIPSRYNEEELFEIWSRFADDADAVQILADFMGLRTYTNGKAQALIARFEIRREAESLDTFHRGKVDRVIHHV